MREWVARGKPSLKAVEKEQVWRSIDWLNRPTPRTLDAVEQVSVPQNCTKAVTPADKSRKIRPNFAFLLIVHR